MAEIDQAVVERMVALVRELAGDPIVRGNIVGKARAIVAELPAPVDPDADEVRSLFDRKAEPYRYWNSTALDCVEQSILAAFKRGRQLATTEAAAAGEGV